MMLRLFCCSLLLGLAVAPAPARGIVAVRSRRAPGLQGAVTQGGRTLPIARVPNLAEGDRISIKLDLPERQGARMLLVAAFLRGATNPPPKDWFFKSKTWKKVGNEFSLKLPAGEHTILLVLAPDRNTHYDAVSPAVPDPPAHP